MRLKSFPLCIAAIAAALSPCLILTVQGGTGYCYFIVLAASLLWLANADNRKAARHSLHEYKWYVLAMAAYPSIVLLQQLSGGYFLPRAIDAPARLLLVIPSFVLLCAVPALQLRWFQMGCAIGALGAAGWSLLVLISPPEWVLSGRAGNPFTNPIPFGDTALLLAFLAAVPRRQAMIPPAWERLVCILGLAAGCFASYVSGSRGAWIALPVMLWLLVSHLRWQRSVTRGVRIGLAVVATLGLMGLATTPIVQGRIADAVSDFHRMERGDVGSSIGMRLQLWEASWEIFMENPLLGVGRGQLDTGLRSLAEQGRASAEIVNAHAHNELFSTLAEMGLLGVVALLLLYFGSAIYFWRYRHADDPIVSAAAIMGLMVTFGTIVFGLTIDVFTLIMNAAFYALTTATLLGIIANRRAALAAANACQLGRGTFQPAHFPLKGNTPT
jgi:O-antigen ligase